MNTIDWPTIQFEEEPIRQLDVRPEVNPLEVIEEKYSRIARRIQLLWGSQELADQFNRWIFVDQAGRQGFPKSVSEALIQLSNRHEEETKLIGTIIKRDFPDRW